MVMGFGSNSNSFKLFMVFLVTCKNDEDLLKNKSTGVLTTFLPLSVNLDLLDVQGQLTA